MKNIGVEQNQAADRFPSTHWSVIAAIGETAGEGRRHALEATLPRYLPALRSHLLYCRRLSADLCDDVLQAFVAEKILSRNVLAAARKERGKFRAFLTVTIDRFALNYLRAERSAGRRLPQREDFEAFVSTEDATPSLAFDVAWARGILTETLAAMQRECESKGRLDIWRIFEARTLCPLLEYSTPVPYEELVKELGFVTPSQAANALVTANRLFVRVLRGVIGSYVTTDESVEDEIQHLRNILASPGARSVHRSV